MIDDTDVTDCADEGFPTAFLLAVLNDIAGMEATNDVTE